LDGDLINYFLRYDVGEAEANIFPSSRASSSLCLTLLSVMEVLPPNTHSYTNRYSPQVIVDYTIEDLMVSNQKIVGALANRKMDYSH
jgi:hypothetical protein